MRPRQKLIEELREKGIKDERVLTAIGKIPRHKLVDTALHNRAYTDSALPIGMGATHFTPIYRSGPIRNFWKVQPWA